MPRDTPHAETIADDLSRAVLEHRLPPGTKLGEDEIAGLYGVSRTIVRGALRALAAEDLVELRRNRGAFVAQPSIREAREVFEARALLEPRTAAWAADRMTPADAGRLHAHIADEHAAMHAGEHGRAVRLSGQFHLEIARIADQATIAGLIARLIARSSLVVALYWRRTPALCEENAHHALVDALVAGDGARAEELMKSHLTDLLSQLDLRERAEPAVDLARALLRPGGL